MPQRQVTRQHRRPSALRRAQLEPLRLDPRDLDIIRAKQLRRERRQPGGTR